MPDLSTLQDLHRRCQQPPPGTPLIERMDWTPPREDFQALMKELERVLPQFQGQILFQTCGRYMDAWEWIRWEDLSHSQKSAWTGDVLPYVLGRGNGLITPKHLGVLYYDSKQDGTPLADRLDRMKTADPTDCLRMSAPSPEQNPEPTT